MTICYQFRSMLCRDQTYLPSSHRFDFCLNSIESNYLDHYCRAHTLADHSFEEFPALVAVGMPARNLLGVDHLV
jgi:hypothetical protein